MNRYQDDRLKELEMEKLGLEIEELKHTAWKSQREANSVDNSDWEWGTYRFYKPVSDTSAQILSEALDLWIRRYPDGSKPYTIEIHSPGGSVFPGMALLDKIEFAKSRGVHVVTKGYGMVASMGAYLFNAGSLRVLSPLAHLLIHEISAGAIGTYSDMQDEVALVGKLQEPLLAQLAGRSRMTVEEIKDKIRRQDWWLSSSEALEAGFCDAIQL